MVDSAFADEFWVGVARMFLSTNNRREPLPWHICKQCNARFQGDDKRPRVFCCADCRGEWQAENWRVS